MVIVVIISIIIIVVVVVVVVVVNYPAVDVEILYVWGGTTTSSRKNIAEETVCSCLPVVVVVTALDDFSSLAPHPHLCLRSSSRTVLDWRNIGSNHRRTWHTHIVSNSTPCNKWWNKDNFCSEFHKIAKRQVKYESSI